MRTETLRSVLIVGGGALGAYYGWRLSAAAYDVSIACRSNYEAVSRSGFQIRSGSGVHRFIPTNVFDGSRPPQYARFDALLIATKANDVRACAEQWVSAAGEHTPVCLLQNGLDVECDVREVFAKNPIISIVPYVAAGEIHPGIVEHYARGDVVIGHYPTGSHAALADIAGLFRTAGVPCVVASDIRLIRWGKAAWNAAFNGLSALTDGWGTRDMLSHPRARKLVSQLMCEVCAVAAADGYPLPEDFVETTLRATENMINYVPSTGQDKLRHKALEIDALFERIREIAAAHSVPTPGLDLVTDLLCMVNERSRN